MKYKIRYCQLLCQFGVLLLLSLGGVTFANAQTLPSTADPSRIDPLPRPIINEQKTEKIVVPELPLEMDAPESAERIKFVLKKLQIEGVTAFDLESLEQYSKQYLQQEIPLTTVWKIAAEITRHYKDQGYFLSRAYVPMQEIQEGTVVIKVIEGYINDIDIEGGLEERHYVVRKLVERLESNKPINSSQLESFMLQMNALPGKEFRAFLEPIKDRKAGTTRLSLETVESPSETAVNIDNFGSRFLGPYQTTLTHKNSFIPLHDTVLTALVSVPTDELKYAAFSHSLPIYPDLEMELTGSYVTARPGGALEPNDIRSSSIEFGIGVNWQPLRQRQENMTFSLFLDSKNSNGDILVNNPFIRDRIRILRATMDYDNRDQLNGYNYVRLSLNKGLELLGSSDHGDANLSRAEAEPDFTSFQFTYIRQQVLSSNFLAIGQLSTQLATDPLFSSEEFGYGGQSFGRAYDSSEITGEHGISGSVELRYLGLSPWKNISLSPYGFYDIGRVWNKDTGGIDQSCSSTGLGLLASHKRGISSNLGIAWPLTCNINTPIYGNGKNPRLILKLSYDF